MTNKLTGNGRPSMHLKGEVGQYYEDMLTGDLYECRVASEFSKTNGRPFGGYVWELRAKGEDVEEIYRSQAKNGVMYPVKLSYDIRSKKYSVDKTYDELKQAVRDGKFVFLVQFGIKYYYLEDNGDNGGHPGLHFTKLAYFNQTGRIIWSQIDVMPDNTVNLTEFSYAFSNELTDEADDKTLVTAKAVVDYIKTIVQ